MIIELKNTQPISMVLVSFFSEWFYPMKSEYATFSRVTKIKRSSFLGTPGIRTAATNYSFSPLPEFLEDDAIWEALSTDPDAFQHTIASQLLQHQGGINLTRLRDNEEKHNGISNPLVEVSWYNGVFTRLSRWEPGFESHHRRGTFVLQFIHVAALDPGV